MAATAYAVSEGQKFLGDSHLTVVECNSCHITYAIPTTLYNAAQKWHGDKSNGWKIFCPLGHQWWFIGENEKERLERQLKRARDDAGRLAADLDQTEARRVAQKAATTRARNERNNAIKKIRKGICPVKGCGRPFKNVEAHIAKKHPDYDIPHDHD